MTGDGLGKGILIRSLDRVAHPALSYMHSGQGLGVIPNTEVSRIIFGKDIDNDL